jgi:alpha/beta superfamily hydrolase
MNNSLASHATRERSLYLSVGQEQIYAFEHLPTRAASAVLVLCHACAEEKHWAHRVYVSFGRELAAAGYALLRLDYRGEGESDREFEQASLGSRVEDAVAGVAYAGSLYPQAPLVLVGHRVGSMVAALAAASLGSRIAGLALWDPVYDGRDYLMQVLRQHLATQMALTGRVSHTREELFGQMESGGRVVLEGYGFGGEFSRELVATRWIDNSAVYARPVLIAETATGATPKPSPRLVALAAQHRNITALAVRERAFWRETRDFNRTAPQLFVATQQWLAGMVR